MVSQDFAEIARLISEADLVIGVFPDHQCPDGMWHVVIKGIGLLHRASGLGVMTTLKQLTDSVRRPRGGGSLSPRVW